MNKLKPFTSISDLYFKLSKNDDYIIPLKNALICWKGDSIDVSSSHDKFIKELNSTLDMWVKYNIGDYNGIGFESCEPLIEYFNNFLNT